MCTFDSCFFSQKPDLEFSILSSCHGKRRCTFISFLLRLKLNGYNLLIMRWINTGVCYITRKQERTRNKKKMTALNCGQKWLALKSSWIRLHSCARHFSLTVSLSDLRVQLGTSEKSKNHNELQGITLWCTVWGEAEVLPDSSCNRNKVKFQMNSFSGLKADFS